MKLTVELVPRTAWYSNVRSNVSTKEWDRLRRKCYELANRRCEICKGVGTKHPVECHETWQYDDTNHIQKLIGLIALCPNCHKVKHPGLAQMKGETKLVEQQLMKVNGITYSEAITVINEAFKQWERRSMYDWKLDISYLDTY